MYSTKSRAAYASRNNDVLTESQPKAIESGSRPAPTRKAKMPAARRLSSDCEWKTKTYREKEFRFFVDQRGLQHFNFKQMVWLDSSVQMAFTRVHTAALKTLAVNLLTLSTNQRNHKAALGVTSRMAVSFAHAFSRECLMGAPDGAWALPKATIEAWIESHMRRRHRKSRR